MPFDSSAEDLMYDAISVDQIRFHTADPGAAAANEIAGTATAVSLAASSGGQRQLAGTVSIISTEASTVNATYFTLWSGATRRGKFPMTSVQLEPGIAKNLTGLTIDQA